MLTNDQIRRAVAFNAHQKHLGVYRPEDEALAVAYLQDGEGLTVDGMAGSIETLPAMHGLRPAPDAPGVTPFSGWVYPLPILPDGTKPGISSSFGKDGKGNEDRPEHWGVDIMYPRHGGDSGPFGKARAPHYSKNWYCPGSVPVYAVGPGTVWSVNWGANNNVKLDHHDVPGFGPLCTWYQHCYDVLVKPGQEVEAGQVIAIVGAGSSNLYHLHHEWRDHNRGSDRGDVVVDPAPFIAPFALRAI